MKLLLLLQWALSVPSSTEESSSEGHNQVVMEEGIPKKEKKESESLDAQSHSTEDSRD